MPDLADKAQERIEAELDCAIAAARGVPSQKLTVADSADDCAECGLEIPSARQIAIPGVQVCVDCQAMLEHKIKRG